MNRRSCPRPGAARPTAAGFSLIEVLVAMLVLGIGLLGFALLQTMNVRFTQSANFRTQATNLTYEMFDQMRISRVSSAAYLGDYTAATANCTPATGANLGATQFRNAWSCRLGKALGQGATAAVARNGQDVTVSISWGDDRWDADATARTFSATTQL
ncbi:type IV pilus modification protein PilV [Pseudoxanthomonas broegbernensis]|uniref:Type IV pilus modification protein PilV n=1 Tax=Pseudoxanthomonas broegbernensis TaxID=83619 RepID=A0A7V8GM53_9GAMM|nr:type IV pilus modification protein PilV [Pseudoxanthomonas broegbernensis]KAF1686159.1 type IV pilus modification protein PilV [Pseudoxanthomonas broegbernensis]MBB6063863.1 type IV pilus assembly protein PilV [Pseudoxanthomonas broegbernensis]